MKQTIAFSLDKNEINRAIKELERFSDKFNENITRFIEKLSERGVEISKIQILSLGAIDTGQLLSSMRTMMYKEDNRGIVFTDCPWAAFVEFGTGVVGAENPHPTLPWAYDVNNHGNAGWVYWNDQENGFRWTKGMSSRPFMYNTAQQLLREAENIAREVFT